MKRSFRSAVLAVLWAPAAMMAQNSGNVLLVHADVAKDTISRFIYSQFAEHLGHCIYGGIWVGENSPIPNTRGMRNDVVDALRKIRVAALRWPGGCYADGYHWRDGIGPRADRPRTVNATWGGVTEDNSFGTHEFMDLCAQLGCEPVICGNIGSGTVEEMSDWVRYLTSGGDDPMSRLRRSNGREKPWEVRFWGVGNEAWGCGGIMSADFYANEMARYSRFLNNYGGNALCKIASGGLQEDYHWTETIMKKWGGADGWLQGYLGGYSLHYYTVPDWNRKGSATAFSERDWFATLAATLRMDELVTKHSAIMDRYDPEKKIGLIVDEWGDWFDVEPGTNPAFLYQQNTLRDAMVAAVNLNIFHRHCDRVKMTNISQMVNVLQAMILTRDREIVLTPTYYVFRMYAVHQDALLLPTDLACDSCAAGGVSMPAISASASRDREGNIHVSLANLDPVNAKTLRCTLKGAAPAHVSGEIITAAAMNAYNDFDRPESVNIQPFTGAQLHGGVLTIALPAKSIVTLQLTAPR
ncbi:MAG TPA: alpha-L-arabinofuranosidase C-terminal domain-containing protein [Bacteroidota bacterium]|nr:alpha-L-arabinofuranosidase C-terminal domain-containing protein [Bacteroidota bacterium]